jgi:phage-related tail fiber protein
MKKNTIALFAAILLSSTTFATGSNDPILQTQKEFNRMFAQATEVKWQEVATFYKVTFMYAGQHLTAFYSPSGELESVSRNISTAMLPLWLQKDLREKLTNAWVSESFEVAGRNGTTYYVTLENANEKTLYASNSTHWSVYKRAQK